MSFTSNIFFINWIGRKFKNFFGNATKSSPNHTLQRQHGCAWNAFSFNFPSESITKTILNVTMQSLSSRFARYFRGWNKNILFSNKISGTKESPPKWRNMFFEMSKLRPWFHYKQHFLQLNQQKIHHHWTKILQRCTRSSFVFYIHSWTLNDLILEQLSGWFRKITLNLEFTSEITTKTGLNLRHLSLEISWKTY